MKTFREWLREKEANNFYLFSIRQNSKKSENIYGYYIEEIDFKNIKSPEKFMLKNMEENLKELVEDLNELETKYSKYTSSEKKEVEVLAMKEKIKLHKIAIKKIEKQIKVYKKENI